MGADVSIYWGLSDGGENKAAWDNVARIGNIFRKDTTANALELRGFDTFQDENYFDLARQDKGYLGVAANGVSTLTNGPGNRGYDFNGDSDYMNAGIGITHGDHFAEMGIGYFTAQEAGAHTFGLPVLMTGPLFGSISIRTVILSGMVTMDRKFYVPEIIQPGHLLPFLEIMATLPIKAQLISVLVTIKLYLFILNMVEVQQMSSVLVRQV